MADAQPDFILMGQQKAATCWLYDQLRHADQFWLPPMKEITYFVGEIFKKGQLRKLVESGAPGGSSPADISCVTHLSEIYRTRRIDDAGYLKIFSFKGDKLTGDITPKYEKLNDAGIQHVLRVAPSAKFIYFIRHPVERLESAIRMKIQWTLPTECLSDVKVMQQVLQRDEFVKRASPTRTWKRWSDAVAPGQIAYWFFDDIRDAPERVRSEVATYLGAADTRFSIEADHNAKGGKALPDAFRKMCAITSNLCFDLKSRNAPKSSAVGRESGPSGCDEYGLGRMLRTALS
jgi:hypothetical protein